MFKIVEGLDYLGDEDPGLMLGDKLKYLVKQRIVPRGKNNLGLAIPSY